MLLVKAHLIALLFAWAPPHSFAFNSFRASSFPFPYYYKTGDSIVLSCWLPSGYTFSYWTLPSNEFVSTTNGRFLVEMTPLTASLTVTNAVITDEGEYICNARYGARSESSSVSAHYTDPLIIYSTSVNATVNVGGSFRFSCNATNYIRAEWIFHEPGSNGRLISNTSDGSRVITPDNEFHLNNIQFENEGMYECRLSNNLGMLSLRNNVTVVARPEVYTNGSFIEVTENSGATLSCTVTGVPLPTITWTDRSGRLLEASGGWDVSTSNNSFSVISSNLTFPRVQSSQTGPYTCWGTNKYGNSSGTINLRLHDTPESPRNVMLELVNQTNIRVTWAAPHSSVDSYKVLYHVLNGSSAGNVETVSVSASMGTTAVLTGLDRLTGYSVVVYATNTHGASPNSNQETIVTSAEVPGRPSAVVVLDVGPTSLRVEWPSSSLPQDDGGAALVGVRITALRVEAGQLTVDVTVTADLEDGFVILRGLKDSSSYKIMVEFSNEIGYGSGLVSGQYQTPLPGAPGSPIHVMAHNVTSNSVLVCWEDSSSGQPFLSYKFEVEEAGEVVSKIYRKDAEEVKSYSDNPRCSRGIMLDQLNSESCFKFRVIAINSVGTGQPSSPSDERCTTKSKCDGGSDCNLQCKAGSKNCSPSVGGLNGTPMIIVAAAVPTVAVVLCVLVTLACCVTARRAKMRKLEEKGDCIPGIDRRGSSNSATKLLVVGRIFSESFSSSSPNHSPEAPLEQPGTATTLISNVFEADFAKSTNHEEYHRGSPRFNVSVAHTPSHNPQPMFHVGEGHPHGVFQLPQHEKKGGKSFAPDSSTHHGMDAPPSYNVCMSATDSARAALGGQSYMNQVDEGKLVMTDNPNYDDRVLPSMTHGQSSNEPDHSNDSTPPPPVPPYYGGSVSDMQSEAITNQYTDTAFLGESFSQVGYSPAQGRKAEPTRSGRARTGPSNLSHNQSTPYPLPGAARGDANNDMNLIENDAYQTFAEVGAPKFEIIGGEERGAVREMVQFRKQ